MRRRKTVVACAIGLFIALGGLRDTVGLRAADIVIFVSNTALNTGDQALNDTLLDWGHTVNVFDHNLPPFDQLIEADESDLVIVSESVTSGSIGSNLNDTETPIINYEPFAFDDMGMTGISSTDAGFGGFDFGFTTNDQTDITIVNPSHPMAASLPAGDVQVYTDPGIITWGQPSDEADVIATVADPEGNESAAIFVYDQGDQMVGETAAGIRIGIFLHNRTQEPSLLTDDGLALLKAAVDYSLGLIDTAPQLQAGDANMDYEFNQLDLVQVQIAAKYLSGRAATWGDGDWDGAPGGTAGSPPAGNGLFDQLDIIAALAAGTYLKGPYAAIAAGGVEGDGQASVGYNPGTGEVFVDAPAGKQLTSINIESAAGIFTGDPAQNLGGSFDNDADNNVFKATFGSSFGSLSFGTVAQPGLSEDVVLGDLTVVGSLAGGGDLGSVDLIYVPEPSTVALVIAGMFGLGLVVRRRP